MIRCFNLNRASGTRILVDSGRKELQPEFFGTSFEILIRLVLFRSKPIISSLDFCTCSYEENIFLSWNFYGQKLHTNHCN